MVTIDLGNRLLFINNDGYLIRPKCCWIYQAWCYWPDTITTKQDIEKLISEEPKFIAHHGCGTTFEDLLSYFGSAEAWAEHLKPKSLILEIIAAQNKVLAG